jgi:hypothetical protein
MTKGKNIRWSIVFILAVLSFSCATRQGLMIWTGEISGEKKHPQVWTLSINGEGQASLSLPYGENIQVTGEAFGQENGSWIFHMDYLEWFSNWHNGWTEARFGMLGSLVVRPRGDSWNLEVQEFPEITGVLEGEIRYKESRYYGDRSRDMVSRRWTRIEAAAPFIEDSLDMESYHFAHKKRDYYSEDFQRDLESLLFPELYGYGDKFPKPDSCKDPEKRYVREEGVTWDGCYSTAYLPEELIPVRDSGTLLRDYEETAGFFTLAVTWQSLWEEKIPRSDITLKKSDKMKDD